MLSLIDRQLIRSYLKSYVVCFVSLISLYVVIDLFNNIEDFTQQTDGFTGMLKHIGAYYGYQAFHIFDSLSEAIVLLAAMFTVAWLQRNNELLPLLSAGVSIRRVIRPVMLSACALVMLNVANQELIIPQLRPVVRDDPNGEKTLSVQAAYDSSSVHLSGKTATRKDQCVRDFTCVFPEGIGPGGLFSLTAKEARYIPLAPDQRLSGGWLLTEATPPDVAGWTRLDVLEPIDPGKYFFHNTDVDFDVLTRNNKWFYHVATWRLFQELERSSSSRLASMAVFFHMRLTRPVLGMILVVMGLGIILRDQNRNVYISAGLCLGLCAIFFGAGFAVQFLGNREFLSPALAAWLPVLTFGPLSLAQFDAIHT
jgi:lipopolysaccharide export system permease protein